MLDIKIETFSALPCNTKEFLINGIDAEVSDFGSVEDTDKESAPRYGCGRMEFIPDDTRMSEAMKRYNITAEEFELVQNKLDSALYVGRCGWCI